MQTAQGSTTRRSNGSPRNVCEELRHWDAAQGGTDTSMQHGLGEHKPHDQHDNIVGQTEKAPKLDRCKDSTGLEAKGM